MPLNKDQKNLILWQIYAFKTGINDVNIVKYIWNILL